MFNEVIKGLFPKVNLKYKQGWIEALRSHDYDQHQDSLGVKCCNQKAMCCLGVAADKFNKGEWIEEDDEYPYFICGRGANDLDMLPEDNFLGISMDVQFLLAALNDGNTADSVDGVSLDGETWSFDEIADFIEEYL